MPLSLTPTVPGVLSLGATAPGRLAMPDWGVVNVTDGFGAFGDGSTDDAAALNASVATNRIIYAPPGKTFMVGSTWTISASNVIVDFSGSTVKKKSTLAAAAISVTGANVTIRNLIVDGNRTGGATGIGIVWTGTGGQLTDATSSHNKNGGVQVSGTGVLTCVRVTASDNVFAALSGDGFDADTGGLLKTYDCVADSNGRDGFNFDKTAADLCVLNGTARRNGRSGCTFGSNRGRSHYFYAEDNDYYGLGGDNTSAGAFAQKWTFDYVESYKAGFTLPNVTATAVEMFGASYNTFGTIVSNGTPGYALAFAGGGTVGSSYNRVGHVLADTADSTNANPGIIICGGSASGSTHNHIGTAYIRGHTVALNIGETTDGGNDHNTIGVLHCEDCSYGCAWFGIGSYNRVDSIISRNCLTSDTTIVGLVSFINTTTTTDNVVGSIDHRTASGTKPKYLVYAAAGTSRNRVENIRSRGDYQTGYASLAGTDNRAGPINGLADVAIIGETCPRATVTSNTIVGLTTQTLTLVGINLREGMKITTLAWLAGSTALAGATNQWFAIYDKNLAKLGVTSDDTSTAWSANAVKSLNLSATVTTTYEGLYYIGCMVKATTVPTLSAAPIPSTVAVISPVLAGTSTGGLTNPASAPSTAGAISAFAAIPYAYAY